MTWFADLSEWTYMGFTLPQLRAVGWLSRDHAYPTGDVPTETFHSLCRLLRKPWAPWAFGGFHNCEFCRYTGGFFETDISWSNENGHPRRAKIRAKSKGELIVPGQGCLYIAPENIAHYMDSHGYCPPMEFLQAVVACPDIDTQAYKVAFLANGGRELMQKMRGMNPIG
jgi:hypothetical protein